MKIRHVFAAVLMVVLFASACATATPPVSKNSNGNGGQAAVSAPEWKRMTGEEIRQVF